MDITFQGNKPQKKTYPFSVKENNNSNTITFILNKEIEGLDLSSLSCYVKVQGLEIDKDVPTIEIEEDKIKVHWTLLRKHTISRVLKVQLQFEGTSDIVWQSEIIEIVLSDTIKADQYIENKYPSVLTNHEDRIKTIEELKPIGKGDIVDNFNSEATDKVLSANQGKVLNDKINTAISGVMHYKGSVQTYDDLPTENLTIGDLYNVIEDDSNYAWTGSEWDMVGSSVDLSNYYNKTETDALLNEKADESELERMVTTDTNQTITGVKGFSTIKIGPNKSITKDNNNFIIIDNKLTFRTGDILITSNLVPYPNNNRDIGNTSYKIRNLYIVGNLTDGTNEVAISDIAKKDLISDQYDNTKNYAVGDLVIYNNTLYRCITAITTAEDFNISKWEATNIDTLLDSKVNKVVKEISFYKDPNNPSQGSKLNIVNDNGYNAKIRFNGSGFMFTAGDVYPTHNKVMNFGNVGYYWKNIFVNESLVFDDNGTPKIISVKDLANLIDYAKGQGWIS